MHGHVLSLAIIIIIHFVQWLLEEFLKYLEDWEQSVDTRPDQVHK